MPWWSYPLNPYPSRARDLIRSARERRGLSMRQVYDGAGLANLPKPPAWDSFKIYESTPSRTLTLDSVALIDRFLELGGQLTEAIARDALDKQHVSPPIDLPGPATIIPRDALRLPLIETLYSLPDAAIPEVAGMLAKTARLFAGEAVEELAEEPGELPAVRDAAANEA